LNNEPTVCFLCHRTTLKGNPWRSAGHDRWGFSCGACGDYEVPHLQWVQNCRRVLNPLLSAWTRRAFDRGDTVFVSDDLIERFADMDSPSVAHKQARLLQWLAGRGTPGSKIKIKMADDWPVAECCNSEEFHYHCVELTRRNFVVGKATTECFLAMLSTEGWRELEIRNWDTCANRQRKTLLGCR